MQSVRLRSSDFAAQGNPSFCALVGLCHLLPVRPGAGPFTVVNKCCPETEVTGVSKDQVPVLLRLAFWCGEAYSEQGNKQTILDGGKFHKEKKTADK